ncbi:hypothetical protein GLW03_15170 [Halobacillus halophilus]|uniref:hypothetical protein n=1 Tax=Halobacillus halophilus TaxID=1570 RepID=UPI00136E045B|nr:hypothetical protein [Halobacillus halophilus]MYL31159.1 hypothetical protein [Halobacillus halophilus]
MRLFPVFFVGSMLLFSALLHPHEKFQELAYSWSDDLNIASSVQLSHNEGVFFQPLSFPPDQDETGPSAFIHDPPASLVQSYGLLKHQVVGVLGESKGFLTVRHANSTYT